MMKRLRARVVFMASFLVIGAASLVLNSCGGGGGGGGGGGAPPGTQSAGAGAAGAQQAIGGVSFGLGSLSGSFKPSFKAAKSKSLNASVAGFYKGLAAYRAKAKTISAFASTGVCTVSGTDDLTGTATSFTWTFTNCVSNLSSTEQEYQNGTLSYSETASGFNFSLTNFTDRITSGSTLLSENVENITVTGTFGGGTVTCNSGSFPSTFSMTIDGTFSDKEDFTGPSGVPDGVLDINEGGTATNLTVAVTVNAVDAAACSPTDMSITESGSFAYTDNLDANNSFSMSSISMTITAVAVTSPAPGQNVTVNGSFSCSSSCFSGTLNIATTTSLFFPDSSSSDCPDSGVIVITGTLTGTITYTGGGGVSVDEGSNGSVDATYTTCDEVEACV